jgi:hypothetical protein
MDWLQECPEVINRLMFMEREPGAFTFVPISGATSGF